MCADFRIQWFIDEFMPLLKKRVKSRLNLFTDYFQQTSTFNVCGGIINTLVRGSKIAQTGWTTASSNVHALIMQWSWIHVGAYPSDKERYKRRATHNTMMAYIARRGRDAFALIKRGNTWLLRGITTEAIPVSRWEVKSPALLSRCVCRRYRNSNVAMNLTMLDGS